MKKKIKTVDYANFSLDKTGLSKLEGFNSKGKRVSVAVKIDGEFKKAIIS